ncbi:MAG: tetratricopeptide repeat protein, partial [Caulobacteraceae bacterium]|nr:tetratricopeptide repeat protein [Caulobacteraceae bacterium]
MPAETAASERDIQILRETVAASQGGDLERAFALAQAALADGLTHPVFHRLRGLKHERQGDLEAAAADFRDALADAPNDFATLNALGACLAKLGRPGEALSALDVALSLEPGFAPAHCHRGGALEALGQTERAREAYEGALQHDPGSIRALGALALMAARRGDAPEARALAARALELESGEPVAHLALGLADLETGDVTAAERRARTLLENPALSPQDQGIALTLLGDAVDGQDRAEEAFGAYE